MDEWLDYVAQAIVNARSIIAGDVIVGGEAAQHLEDSDIEDLKARVIARSPFAPTISICARATAPKTRTSSVPHCDSPRIISTISVVLRYAADFRLGGSGFGTHGDSHRTPITANRMSPAMARHTPPQARPLPQSLPAIPNYHSLLPPWSRCTLCASNHFVVFSSLNGSIGPI